MACDLKSFSVARPVALLELPSGLAPLDLSNRGQAASSAAAR